MKENSELDHVFVVVDIWRGIAENAFTFVRKEDAINCLNRLRRARNLVEDDVQLFETTLGALPQ